MSSVRIFLSIFPGRCCTVRITKSITQNHIRHFKTCVRLLISHCRNNNELLTRPCFIVTFDTMIINWLSFIHFSIQSFYLHMYTSSLYSDVKSVSTIHTKYIFNPSIKKAKSWSHFVFVRNSQLSPLTSEIWVISCNNSWNRSRNRPRLSHLTSVCNNKSACCDSFSSSWILNSRRCKLLKRIELTMYFKSNIHNIFHIEHFCTQRVLMYNTVKWYNIRKIIIFPTEGHKSI